MQITKKRKISDDENDEFFVPINNHIQSLRGEVDELKRSRKYFFSKINDVSKAVAHTSKHVSKLEKKCKDVSRHNSKLESDIVSLKINYKIEKQLKEEYRQTVDDLEDTIDAYDNTIIQLQMEQEDSKKDKDTLLDRLSAMDECRISVLESDSNHLANIKTLLSTSRIHYHLNEIDAVVNDVSNSVGMKEVLIDDGVCVVCKDMKSKYAFYPCGHFCVCPDCFSLKLERCPYCRENINGGLRVYPI